VPLGGTPALAGQAAVLSRWIRQRVETPDFLDDDLDGTFIDAGLRGAVVKIVGEAAEPAGSLARGVLRALPRDDRVREARVCRHWPLPYATTGS
jgi:hypothetical protein